MTYKNIYLIFIFILSFFSNSFVFCAKTISGDSNNNQTSFNFPIGAYAVYNAGDSFDKFIFYVASNEEKPNNLFSIAAVERWQNGMAPNFTGCTPKLTKINEIENQNNPLCGAKISSLNLIGNFPVIVKEGDKKIYFLNSLSDKESSLYSSVDLRDSKKQPINKIKKLAVADSSNILGSYIFAAVKGDMPENDGIALLFVDSAEKNIKVKNKETKKDEDKKVKVITLNPLNADSADSDPRTVKEKDIEKILAGNKAAPLTGASKSVRINSDAEIIGDNIDMHWDKILHRLYIVFDVKSGQGGARAAVVGRVWNHRLYFEQIAPDSAFIGNNQIIGTGQSNQSLSIQKVRTMHTSTLLNYLIVVSKDQNNQNSVYALPLVNKKYDNVNIATNPEQGTLAKIDQLPKESYVQEFFVGRAFSESAKSPNDLLTQNDDAAKVGGGLVELKPGEKISDIFVVNDSVFICIGTDNPTTPQGIFYSQAIFNNKGIKAWTKWQSIAGTDEKVFGAGLDITSSKFWYLTGRESNKIDTLKVSQWESNKTIDQINRIFPESEGGVHGIFDFTKSTLGFNNFSMIIATGSKKIALIETGNLQDGIYKPAKDNKLLLISNGDLNQIGAITTVEIVTDSSTDDSWIIVGGTNGLAVLTDKSGNGWKGKISSLNNIPSNLVFKKIGKYSFVKKIQFDGQFLYVLTNDKFDKIKISKENLVTGNLDTKNLANNADKRFKFGAFLDFGVSSKFALLGSSGGLYRVGNGKDITIANNMSDISWTYVNVPNSAGPISQLLFISPTGNDLDFAKKGQVYVHSSYRGFNSSRINRFYVELNNEINDSTMIPLEDKFTKDRLSNFFDFGTFREYFWTNGALLLNSSSFDTGTNFLLRSITPKVSAATKSMLVGDLVMDLDIDLKKLKIVQIGRVIKDSATGYLIINGNFGLRVNK